MSLKFHAFMAFAAALGLGAAIVEMMTGAGMEAAYMLAAAGLLAGEVYAWRRRA